MGVSSRPARRAGLPAPGAPAELSAPLGSRADPCREAGGLVRAARRRDEGTRPLEPPRCGHRHCSPASWPTLRAQCSALAPPGSGATTWPPGSRGSRPHSSHRITTYCDTSCAAPQ